MKSLFIALSILAFAVCANAQTPLYPATYHIGGTSGSIPALPAASTMKGRVVNVDNGTDGTDCTAGGGTANHACRSDGSIWAPWGDGNVIGSGVVVSVSANSPVSSTGGTAPVISIDNAAADGSTKGAVTGNANDFNDNGAGMFSIDYTNGQSADATHKGFLTFGNWNTFNGKLDPTGNGSGLTGLTTTQVGIPNVTNDAQLKIASNLSDLANAGTARGNLGGSTVGQNLFTASNPGAISFPKVAADNSVSFRTPAQVLADILAAPSARLINTTSPITGGGDLSADRTIACATCVVAPSPGAGIAHFAGSTQAVTSSLIVNADITTGTIDLTTKVAGVLPIANGGTNKGSWSTGSIPYFDGTRLQEDNANFFWDGSAHRLGIGTASPGTLLHLYSSFSSGGPFIRLQRADATTTFFGGLGFYAQNGTKGFAIENNVVVGNDTLEFNHGSTNFMRINTAGDIGVISHLNPLSGYTSNLGSLSTKYLALHAAELWVETLVAQNTIATIGGRVLVAPTTPLSADVGTGDTSITVKYNNLNNGDRVYLESNGKVEFMAVTSGASGSSGAYVYSVTRDLDGSGANAWFAGDAALNTGTTGNGFIDLYSTAGVLSGTGPTIVGNVRTGAAYNAISPRWAIGNLNGLYGYGSDTYGAAFGTPSGAWLKIDPTNGVRIGHNTTTLTQIDASGNASFSGQVTATTGAIGGWNIISNQIYSSGGITLQNSATPVNNKIFIGTGDYNSTNTSFYVDGSGQFSLKNKLVWDSATSSLSLVSVNALSGALTGTLSMSGSSSAIAIGTTPPTSASAGTGIWLDRTGMYGLLSNVVQAKFDATTGAITAGGGRIALNDVGALQFGYASADTGTLGSDADGSTVLTSFHGVTNGKLALQVNRTSGDNYSLGNILLQNTGSTSWDARLFSPASPASPPGVGNPYSGGAFNVAVLAGFTVGDDAAPNAMLDVRGDIFSTGSLGATGSRLVKGWFTDLQVTNAINGSLTGNAGSATILATARTIAGVSFNGSANIAIPSSGLSDGSNIALLNATNSFSATQNIAMTTPVMKLTNTAGSVSGSYGFYNGATKVWEVASNFTVGPDLEFNEGATNRVVIYAGGGVVIGAASGGSQGGGTLNVQNDIYKGGSAYTNPDFVFEHAFTGKINRFTGNEGAASYRGLMSLDELETYVRTNYHLPGFGPEARHGVFSGGDMLLKNLESTDLYLFQLNDRIRTLEALVTDLKKSRK